MTAEVRVKHAQALVHRVWEYETIAPGSEFCAAFVWTTAAHDFAKDQMTRDQPKGVMYLVTEIFSGEQKFYRKEKDSEGQSQG
jgi:hypothetical protein